MIERKSASGASMLDMWRPPQGAGDPIGCLATTFTFAPGLFEEQCLARFLGIESEPNREGFAFRLERDTRLGSIYAAVLVDHTQAGVEHSLQWDVLPVRIRGGKQHAKVSLLAWSRHVRIIVASANLTDPGYRTNFEIASAIDLRPEASDSEIVSDVLNFLRSLVMLVPGASDSPPEVLRAESFLDQTKKHVASWKQKQRSQTIRRQFVCTLPASVNDGPARSSLAEAIEICRSRGGSPSESKIASPFFDADLDAGNLTAALCKWMARGRTRELLFCVPAISDGNETITAMRLAAPKALLDTPKRYSGNPRFEILPQTEDKNQRAWHAKMMSFASDSYFALMTGSSNFTCAGMGVGQKRNSEANILTIVDQKAYGREITLLKSVWPEMPSVPDPQSAEWLGSRAELDEEEQTTNTSIPRGFLLATFRSGGNPQIVLRFDPEHLPQEWQVHACGPATPELLSSFAWRDSGSRRIVEIAWQEPQSPEKLLIRWEGEKAFLPINVEDSGALPPPKFLDYMTANDMLWILAASDPSAAFRAWSRSHQKAESSFDEDFDSAIAAELDPLRRYDLQSTFLHRIRRRARVLAQLRSNLERPAWGRQALDWRLRGLMGLQPLAYRLVQEFEVANGNADEALLALADFLIVLREVDYQPGDGFLTKADFDRIFRAFLRDLAGEIEPKIAARRKFISEDSIEFWKRVMERCQS